MTERNERKEEPDHEVTKISPEDLDIIIEEDEAGRFEKKLKEAGRFSRTFFKRIKLLIELIRDWREGTYRRIPWRLVAAIAAALLYFINPLDFIPDIIVGIGLLDDAAVMAIIYKSLERELRNYCEFKGYDPEEYF